MTTKPNIWIKQGRNDHIRKTGARNGQGVVLYILSLDFRLLSSTGCRVSDVLLQTMALLTENFVVENIYTLRV